MKIVSAPDAAFAALSPLRRQILSKLGEPLSASEVAEALGLTRQRVNYHLSLLESHGRVEIAEVRQRRGFQERRFRRVGPTVIAPDLLGPTPATDDLSADAVVAAASDAIRAVGELEAEGQPHPTATLVTDVRFASPADHRAFLAGVAELAAKFDRGEAKGALAIRVTVLNHVAKGAKR